MSLLGRSAALTDDDPSAVELPAAENDARSNTASCIPLLPSHQLTPPSDTGDTAADQPGIWPEHDADDRHCNDTDADAGDGWEDWNHNAHDAVQPGDRSCSEGDDESPEPGGELLPCAAASMREPSSSSTELQHAAQGLAEAPSRTLDAPAHRKVVRRIGSGASAFSRQPTEPSASVSARTQQMQNACTAGAEAGSASADASLPLAGVAAADTRQSSICKLADPAGSGQAACSTGPASAQVPDVAEFDVEGVNLAEQESILAMIRSSEQRRCRGALQGVNRLGNKRLKSA